MSEYINLREYPKTIPFGRIKELAIRLDALLFAVRPGRGVFSDLIVKRYSSRLALETFLKNPGDWYAVVKTPTDPSMLIYPAFQRSFTDTHYL